MLRRATHQAACSLLGPSERGLLFAISGAPSDACSLDGASSTPSTSYSQVRFATKKAGGNANQAVGSQPKNLGVKMTEGELIFPGMVIVRQRGTQFHPGYNVGIGKDHTLFATQPGFLRFDSEKTSFGKERRVVSVQPLNGDWTTSYGQVAASVVARRAQIKRSKIVSVPLEPALYTPLTVQDGKLSWRGPRPAPVSIPSQPTPPAKSAAAPKPSGTDQGKKEKQAQGKSAGKQKASLKQ